MTEQTNSNDLAVKPENHGKGFSIAAMVCGIVSLVFCWNIWMAIILAILALVFGIIALAKKYPAKGMAVAGVVTGGVGLVTTILVYVLVFATMNALVETVQTYDWDDIDWSEIDWDDYDWD